ncbi:MAG: ATP-binding protein [Pseudobdellovibrio sp.]
MTSLKTALDTEDFQNEVMAQTHKFAEITSKYLSAMLCFESNIEPGEFLTSGIKSNKNIFISVMYTGTVFGEYVLAINEELAAQIVGKTFENKTAAERLKVQSDITETFSELLNLVVGESIVGLVATYKKLTITAPKVIFGTIKFPHVKAGYYCLTTSTDPIECYLYVDRMKLDIATSYSDTLSSLEVVNTELRSAMTQLQEQQEHLIQSEKLAALGTMAAGVAHEINTPLATISVAEGNLKSLLDDVPNTFDRASFSKMLNVIDQTVFRIAKITNALRDYAKNSSSAAPQIATARHIVNEALIFCQSHIQDKGIAILTDSISDKISIKCRTQQISQIIFNILTNSCDAIEASSGEKWINIEAIETAAFVEFRITDSGEGISLNIQKKIFDPFFTTKAIGQGYGLGLSVAKGIVDIHKGQIFVNQQSKNTQIVIQLPKTI